ncbi:hypothetical protein PILCRDRAFT_825258 [Piloderma croceum F 1598]|uniref:ATP synthase subunit J, mitochondrial n=1 Tax=Piloderma croceum (strain F 1598) TaxID=765440 RepID=A0A0C3FCG7_PILCF|nr:hypothetical protein PILCRDRAFT_825258 [Piloderma croceum F 1598]
MSFLGLRKWPTPVMKPMWPFMAAAGITFYLISVGQAKGIRSPEYRNDPKNPYAAQLAKESAQ